MLDRLMMQPEPERQDTTVRNGFKESPIESQRRKVKGGTKYLLANKKAKYCSEEIDGVNCEVNNPIWKATKNTWYVKNNHPTNIII